MHDHPDQVQTWLTDADIPITMPTHKLEFENDKAPAAHLFAVLAGGDAAWTPPPRDSVKTASRSPCPTGKPERTM
jgi:hypothetical protein